ncbi:MAG TPA: glycosyltransferase [Pyrinomonadaceae bacterium]|nr:glycosyltransferase [Pyrinomonadaceae bacterium]
MSRLHDISVIIATLGRPEPLARCLESLTKQVVPVAEVIVVHCGSDEATKTVTSDQRWQEAGMNVRYYYYPERNCAAQRNFGVKQATHDNLLLLDDDVEVDVRWTEELFNPLWNDKQVGATMGKLVNQPMPAPTPFWRLYRILLHGKSRGLQPGLLVGAALPNGFPTDTTRLIPCEWIGGGASAIRREAFESVGGFASFFKGSSPGEDLDLGYRLSRKWKIYYVSSARCIHHQSPTARETLNEHQYLSMRSRFAILTMSMGKTRVTALAHILFWAFVQGLSELANLRRGVLNSDLPKAWVGRMRGFMFCLRWHPEQHEHNQG